MDADRFDTIARTLHSTPTRRLTLGALTALGLAAILGDHEVAAKKKGGGKKDGGKKKKKKGVKCQGKSCKKEEEKQFCHPAGEQCTFTPYPCCPGTLCCNHVAPYNTGFCVLPSDECCRKQFAPCTRSIECCDGLCCFEGQCIDNSWGGSSEICSGDDSLYCCEGYKCVKPDGIFGTCQPG